ncbi:hypothetical protein [Streptomyces acidicola]|uniref:Uncharacterized protein n=1 Tax=Streptomyces acidicola TaxID=2596892 RepID=A0A5N8WLE5_9ACTN|nr:hypothetical protein [Streptomyces acidicola]MPY48089.1 hypothetical protein [Streptomyces acidicola]
MPGPRLRRTASPRAHDGWERLWLVLLVVSAIFALFCLSAPTADAAGPRVPSPVSAPVSTPLTAAPSSTVGERLEVVAPRHAEQEPCEEGSGQHHCDSPDHHGVLGHPPLMGADRAASPGQPATTTGPAALDPSREPGAARPPDLHELQLLRV